MPVADTELLFALNPKDKKHEYALKALDIRGLKVPDTALLEFLAVLRSRGRTAREVSEAVVAIKRILEGRKVREIQTISTDLIIKQAELEEKYNLSFFDSLIAASALSVDSIIISDDRDFDKIPNLKRIPLTS